MTAEEPAPRRRETSLPELLLYVLGFMAALALLALGAVWILRRV